MKLPKYTSISITSAAVVIFGFGVLAGPASAQVLTTDDVSQQIVSEIGEADHDEVMVDSLSQVEAELQELGETDYSLDSTDTSEIQKLKLERRDLVRGLRERLSQYTGQEKQEFLQKIRDVRKEVNSQLKQIRQEKKTELQQRRQEIKINLQENREEIKSNIQERREEIKTNIDGRRQETKDATQEKKQKAQEARELFKNNLETQQTQLKEAKKDAVIKFQERVQSKVEKNTGKSEKELIQEHRKGNLEKQQVQGAIDYQPSGLLERFGYWISGLL